ncbi:MAG: hypothetical protein ACX931_09360 [Saccharospirillum sp.]
MTVKQGCLLALWLISLGVAGSAWASCPDFTGSPHYSDLNYDTDALWEEKTHALTAGGNTDLRGCSRFSGVGHVSTNPDFNFHLSSNVQDRMVRIKASAPKCDTVILVNAPDGRWEFNDDDDGQDPAVRFYDARPGRYDIWVGTYDGGYCDATLHLESFN